MVLPGTQGDLYFQRMASSLGDKASILPHLLPGPVLDVGAGGGELSGAMVDLGHRTVALDASPEAIGRIHRSFPSVEPLLGFAADVPTLVAPESMANVVCSSILHEVYSYGVAAGEPGNLADLVAALGAFRQVLEPGGHLVIRDGVRPNRWESPVAVVFDDPRGDATVAEYARLSPFWGEPGPWTVHLAQVGSGHWTGDLGSAMEVLYTYTWGPGALAREALEFYGVLTEDSWVTLLQCAGFEVLSHTQYTQPGYGEHLDGRARILDVAGRMAPWPSSNMLLVARRTR